MHWEPLYWLVLFITLKNIGASLEDAPELYRLLIRKASDSSFIDDVVSCLDLLVSQKVSVASSLHMNAIHIALESPETLNFLLKGLENPWLFFCHTPFDL